MPEIRNRMRVQIYKRDGRFYVAPHLVKEIFNNEHYECGHVYELDLHTGEISMSEYFEEHVGRFDTKYEDVGWGEIGGLDCWNIAPAAMGVKPDALDGLPYNCFINKDFRKDEE